MKSKLVPATPEQLVQTMRAEDYLGKEAGNVGFVCPQHAPVRGRFVGQDPGTFVGHFVKLSFPVKGPTGEDTLEHMWVRVEEQRGDELVGKLDNDPLYECEYRCGDVVAFKVEEIADFLRR